MKILLSQHKNKVSFFLSLILHVTLIVAVVKSDLTISIKQNDKSMAVLFYSPPPPLTAKLEQEIIEQTEPIIQETIEEKIAIKPKKEKPKKIKKETKEKQNQKTNSKEETTLYQAPTQEIATMQNNTPSNVKSQAGGNENELIAHIQLVLNKEAKKNYPTSARKRRQKGVVVVGFVYDNGKCKNIKVIKSSGYDILDDAAVKSVAKAKFKHYPNVININVPISFSLHWYIFGGFFKFRMFC